MEGLVMMVLWFVVWLVFYYDWFYLFGVEGISGVW